MLTIITLLILLGSFVGAATIDYVSPPTPSDGEIISSDSTTIKVNLLDVSNLNRLNFTFNSVTTSMLLNSNFVNGHYSFGPSDGLVLYLPFESGSLTNLKYGMQQIMLQHKQQVN